MDHLGSAGGSSAALIEPAGDDSLRDMLLNQIVELQNTNDQLTSKLFTERQKSATTISQAFQKYRLERQKDTDRIQDLQNEVAALEHRNEQMQNELDRNRQLCGFAHNKLIQLQKMLDIYMERNAEMQKQLDAVDGDNAQLKLACEMVADIPGQTALAIVQGPGNNSVGLVKQPCCEVCLAVVETAGTLLPREKVSKLLSLALNSEHRIDMSTQTDPAQKLDRFVQASLMTDDQTTRPSTAATSPNWKAQPALEDGEIALMIDECAAECSARNPPSTDLKRDGGPEKSVRKFPNKDRLQNVTIKKRKKYSAGFPAT